MADINIVMHKLKTSTILTTDGGRKSNRMVLKWARTVRTIMIVTMDIRIDAMPVIMDPVRNGRHRQQVFNNGPAISRCVYSNFICMETNIEKNNNRKTN